jgi:heme oxygenase
VEDLRSRLRSATAHEHRRTEESFADSLASLPESYGSFLLAHAAAFPAVGRALDASLDWEPWTARWNNLQSDLAALGLAAPDEVALDPAASTAEALGMAYVLEGSRMGSAILLESVPAALPTAYLRGGRDRAPWLKLQALLGAADPAAGDAAVAGACAAFAAFRAAAAAHLRPAA